MTVKFVDLNFTSPQKAWEGGRAHKGEHILFPRFEQLLPERGYPISGRVCVTHAPRKYLPYISGGGYCMDLHLFSEEPFELSFLCGMYDDIKRINFAFESFGGEWTKIFTCKAIFNEENDARLGIENVPQCMPQVEAAASTFLQASSFKQTVFNHCVAEVGSKLTEVGARLNSYAVSPPIIDAKDGSLLVFQDDDIKLISPHGEIQKEGMEALLSWKP